MINLMILGIGYETHNVIPFSEFCSIVETFDRIPWFLEQLITNVKR